MGSFKRHKNRATTRHAIRKIKSPSDPELAAIREQQILPVIRDLLGSDPAARSSAVNSVLSLVQEPKTRKLFLREQFVTTLLEHIQENLDLVKKADAWNILKCLAQEEEADFCVHLYRRDILTSVDVTIQTIIETIESQDLPIDKLQQDEQNLLWNLASSITNLLTCLSESGNEVVEAISKNPAILNFLFGLSVLEYIPLQLQLDVQLCLMALTEDNKTIVDQIIESNNWFNTLIAFKNSTKTISVYACGVLHNIFTSIQWFDHNTPVKDMSDAFLIPILANYIAQFPNGEDDSNTDQILDRTILLALDIIASIASELEVAIDHRGRNDKRVYNSKDDGLGKADLQMEMETDFGPEEIDDDDIDADMEMVTGCESEHEDQSQSGDMTLDRLIRVATPKILQIIQSEEKPSDSINKHALAALNNISWTISNIDESSTHLANLQKMWALLAQEIWDRVIRPTLNLLTVDDELANLITSLSWAVARSVKGVIKLQPNDEQWFINLYQARSKNNSDLEKEDVFQGLGVKCIGVLGHLACQPATTDLNRKIANFLVTVLNLLPNVSSADVVEALNQIFDIYADNRYSYDEPVFWGNEIYKSLEEILPKARKMAKSIDKRKFIELRLRADEAVLNLGRFLAYKKKERERFTVKASNMVIDNNEKN